ncbi:MAG: hypothetical protein ACLTLQ_03520 [[Clostridium] scindens]
MQPKHRMVKRKWRSAAILMRGQIPGAIEANETGMNDVAAKPFVPAL